MQKIQHKFIKSDSPEALMREKVETNITEYKTIRKGNFINVNILHKKKIKNTKIIEKKNREKTA